MKKNLIMLAGLSLLGLAACGDEVTKVNENVEMGTFSAYSALPECSSANVGSLSFAIDSAKVYYCANGSWTSLNGKDGLDGKDGENGKDGADGADGKTVDIGDISVDIPGCIVTDNKNGSFHFDCDSTSFDIYPPICNGKGYDPETHFCAADSLYALCNGLSYDPKTHYCRNKEYVMPVCDENSIDTSYQMCLDGVPMKYITDARDSQKYAYTNIGGQYWMASNLNYKTKESYCYGENSNNCEKYGALYSYKAMRGDSLCPAGWRIADQNDWKTLDAYITDSMGVSRKAILSLFATDQSVVKFEGAKQANGTNLFGFSAIFSGEYYRIKNADASYRDVYQRSDTSTTFWALTSDLDGQLYNATITAAYNVGLYLEKESFSDARYAVRCIRKTVIIY